MRVLTFGRRYVSSTATPGSRLAALRKTLEQDVRPGMELDLCRLSSCLQDKFDNPRYFGASTPLPRVRQLGKRMTYELRFEDPLCQPLVVRCHDRAPHEFRAVAALHELQQMGGGRGVPVPKPHVLIEDPTPLGRPFFVSEYVGGRVFFDAAFTDAPDQVHVAGSQNPRMGSLSTKSMMAQPVDRVPLQYALVDMAACLHTINMGDVPRLAPDAEQLSGGLSAITEIATQIYCSWSEQARQDSRLAGSMDYLQGWLPSALPEGEDEVTCLVHGDLHAQHFFFHPTTPTVAAVGSWENWAVGHPGADLAMLALPYVAPYTLMTTHQGFGMPSTREALGLPSEAAFVQRYVEQSGHVSVGTHWAYYLAHACFRVAASTACRPEPTEDELSFATQMAGAGVGCAARYDQQRHMGTEAAS